MMLHPLAAVAGCALLLTALADAFDTIVLARRVERIFPVTGWFYAATWRAFTFFAVRLGSGRRRERLLSVYGPLSLLGLLLAAGGDLRHQAELTFAMGRHTLADLVSIFRLSPCHLRPLPEGLTYGLSTTLIHSSCLFWNIS